MNLRKKIFLGYGVAFALLSLVLFWSTYHLISLGQASDAILRDNYKSILAADCMLDCLAIQEQMLLTSLQKVDPGSEKHCREQDAAFLQWLARAKDNVTIEGEPKALQKIDVAYSQLMFQMGEFFKQPSDGLHARAEMYKGNIRLILQEIRKSLYDLREINQVTMYQASNRAKKIADWAIQSTLVVGIFAIVFGVFFSIVLSSLVIRPLKSMIRATRKIGQGDYSIRIPKTTNDELGVLALEFNTMAERLAMFHHMNIDNILAEKQKMETILATIEDGILVLDISLNVVTINQTAYRFFCFPQPPSLPKHFLEILREEALFSFLKETVQTGIPPKIPEDDEFLTWSHGSHPRHFSFAITPIRGKGETLLGIVLLFRDVTRLKELDRLKSEFVLAASHELRTPLTSMGMSIDLLREKTGKKLSQEETELLEVAHEEVARLKELINDLLNLSKIEAGKIQMEKEHFGFKLVFERIQSIFATQMAAKKATLLAMVPETLPDVFADPNKISLVLSNLISNALRYSPPQGQITLKVALIKDHFHISIQDNGPGIPEEFQSKIFQKFIQVKGRENAGGTGLGLAIAREIVRAHGGSIWVISAKGEGSTFTFTLPRNETT